MIRPGRRKEHRQRRAATSRAPRSTGRARAVPRARPRIGTRWARSRGKSSASSHPRGIGGGRSLASASRHPGRRLHARTPDPAPACPRRRPCRAHAPRRRPCRPPRGIDAHAAQGTPRTPTTRRQASRIRRPWESRPRPQQPPPSRPDRPPLPRPPRHSH
eukprot:scaffold16900_cov105-Isochrysis_galbana.AAC.12